MDESTPKEEDAAAEKPSEDVDDASDGKSDTPCCGCEVELKYKCAANGGSDGCVSVFCLNECASSNARGSGQNG